MKRKDYLILLSAIAFIAFSLPACQDLDLHYEGGTLDDDQIKETVDAIPDRINSSVSGMYAILGQPNGFFGTSNRADDLGYMSVALGQDLNSGDMVNIVSGYDWFSPALEWTDRDPTYANPQLRLGLFYKAIYATSEVLSAISDDTNNAELKAKRGQAKAIRAFSYLSLAPYFQFKYKGNEDKLSVPLAKEGIDPRNNPRVTLNELYNGEGGIIADLTDAIADLEGYIRPNKGIIDQEVAYGLRARAYLYLEEWDKAAADAEKALVGYTPYGINELTKPGFYNATDHNWLWALLLPADVVGERLASWPSQLGSFSGNAYVSYAGIYRSINVLLWNKIPATDVRKKWWLDENKQSPYLEGLTWVDEDKGITYSGQAIAGASISDVKQPMDKYANVKFGQRAGIGSPYNEGDWCMMRAEELILLRAEAVAHSNLSAGKQILENFVKTYRNPAYTSIASNIEDFTNEVWLQRRIELWGEGFAMADVMRLGKNVVRFHPGADSNVPATYRFNIAASDQWILLRFVQGETTNNPAVVNNEGGTQPKQNDGASLLDGVTD
ncbi:MAG: RagB/SusD family nutrient uptake outer membrane protein [Paludibacter sp.]|jgi:tetratricopeptide (TPR) repeat protein|nr:RagB/SusD family nutrient uptake outer membrane protein [Paludibacter sp.]